MEIIKMENIKKSWLRPRPPSPCICLCSPSTHPGAFRCSRHKNIGRVSSSKSIAVVAGALVTMTTPSNAKLMKAFLNKILTRSSSHSLQSRRNFQPKLSRFCPANTSVDGVISTCEGKGWGLKTLQNLPKGTFVCEYVGEIVTNTELYERNMKSSGRERHTYPVTLDADWGSEIVLKDEEALCLDATFFRNVARFINHRFLGTGGDLLFIDLVTS
ncbi:hypothetical protein COLO4_26719 [Corchorus olitorius]|uniref:SET domain-containing protein n=1 Tax=Corchorus olitorius TaxID=93759 RepID=A0A1R3HV83_9ROSI|nr:hypothetical protein COLO4_26719 [Corchorus olitorius]